MKNLLWNTNMSNLTEFKIQDLKSSEEPKILSKVIDTILKSA